MAASLEPRVTQSGYNKRFAVHSVAKETVPFSAWKQSRGLLSWTISRWLARRRKDGRATLLLDCAATVSSYARNVAVLLPLYQPKGMVEGESWAASTRLLSSVSTWISFRPRAKRLSYSSWYESLRFMNHFRIIYGILDGWMDGWKCMVDCITIVGFSNVEFLA